MITAQGQPVEFFLTPGEYSDTKALALYQFDLPERSKITGDKAYNDYDVEDALDEADLHLTPLRKKNSKRPSRDSEHYPDRCNDDTRGSVILISANPGIDVRS